MQFHAAGISWEDPGVTASFAVTEPERTEVVDKNRVIQVGLCFDVLYDRYMADHVDPWIAVAQRMHPLIAKQAEMARLAFLQLRELIVKAQRHRPPLTEASTTALLQPLVLAVRTVERASKNSSRCFAFVTVFEGVCDADDECDDDETDAAANDFCSNHLRLVAGGINALLWVVSNSGCSAILCIFRQALAISST
jgi:hypothetical protein